MILAWVVMVVDVIISIAALWTQWSDRAPKVIFVVLMSAYALVAFELAMRLR
jgi:hypothetical protein